MKRGREGRKEILRFAQDDKSGARVTSRARDAREEYE